MTSLGTSSLSILQKEFQRDQSAYSTALENLLLLTLSLQSGQSVPELVTQIETSLKDHQAIFQSLAQLRARVLQLKEVDVATIEATIKESQQDFFILEQFKKTELPDAGDNNAANELYQPIHSLYSSLKKALATAGQALKKHPKLEKN